MQGVYQQRGEDTVLKRVASSVPLLIGILLVLSVVFYQERMLFIDAPHVLFRIINDGALRIEEHRYGSFITQMVPLIGAKLHLPFKLIVVLYSASFYLFYLTVALLLVYKFRNYGLAILYGLYLTLFVSDTFYWSNNEVHQGVAWLMLAFAINFHIAARNPPPSVAIPVFMVTFFLAIWTHPLVMIMAVFLWFFLWLSGMSWPFPGRQLVMYSCILVVLSVVKFYQGMNHGYDSTKIEVVTHFNMRELATLFSSPQLSFFARGCLTNYWLFIILFIAGIAAMVRAGKYLLTALTVFFAVGYLVLICITFRHVSTGRFYIESEYMPLTIICSAPFVWLLLPRLNVKLGVVLVGMICAVRVVYILHASTAFTGRVALLDRMLNNMKAKNINKAAIADVGGLDSTFIMHWGAPVESMVLSKLKGESPQRTFIFLDAAQLNTVAAIGNDTLLGCWEKRPASNLNGHYFQLDTSAPYQVVTYESLAQ